MRLRYRSEGWSASAIAESVERSIREGELVPGAALPTVRGLAARLQVSPSTVAAAYRALRQRGLLSGQGRRGTRVSPRPPLPSRPEAPVPEHVRDLSDGNPDPALLPDLSRALRRVAPRSRLYGGAPDREELLALARRRFEADGIPAGAVAVVGGALDGIERVLQAHLRPGDRVAVEDPAHSGVIDLVATLGLLAEPVAVDDDGPLASELERALAAGAVALVATPRAQSPTGAALGTERAGELRRVIARHPSLLVVEDDHAGPVSGAPAVTLAGAGRERWAVVRSVSKSLGPDLRLAVLAGDETTIARVQGRQLVGTGWVSHVLQALVAGLWTDASVARRLDEAAAAYRERRAALIGALAARGILARGRSGFNVWVEVPVEVPVVTGLARRGWAVREGERYRLRSGPAVRITVSTLGADEAPRLAGDLAAALRGAGPVTSA